MDLGSIILLVLVFLVFYQLFIQLSKKNKQPKGESADQNQLLIEKFERLDRAFKYEISDISRSIASLQELYSNMPASPEVIDRLEKIESALKAMSMQGTNQQQNKVSPTHTDL